MKRTGFLALLASLPFVGKAMSMRSVPQIVNIAPAAPPPMIPEGLIKLESVEPGGFASGAVTVTMRLAEGSDSRAGIYEFDFSQGDIVEHYTITGGTTTDSIAAGLREALKDSKLAVVVEA